MSTMFAAVRRSRHDCMVHASRHVQSRRVTSSSVHDTTPPSSVLPATGAAKLTNRRLISLHGSEVPKFLQGILTNSVRPESRAGFYAAFLNAQGRVLNDVFVYPTLGSQWHESTHKNDEVGYLIEVDADQADKLMQHLKRHKLRSKFKLRLLDREELNVWNVWSETDRWTAHTQSQPAEPGSGRIGLMDCRAPGLGQRLILPSASAGNGLDLDVEEVPLEAYTVRRYLRGVPEGQQEIPHADSLPMNCNIDVMGGIDFKKGCYVGQELTIRTHHTGVVRRRILPVQIFDKVAGPPDRLEYSPSTPPSNLQQVENGADIVKDDTRRRTAGKLVARVGNVGLALCRLEQMSDLAVSGEGGSYNVEDRFVMSTPDSHDLGVKAFVPDWLRGRVRKAKVQKRVE